MTGNDGARGDRPGMHDMAISADPAQDPSIPDGTTRYYLVISQPKTGTTSLDEMVREMVPKGAYLGKFHNHRLVPVDPSTMSPRKYARARYDLDRLDRIRALDPVKSTLVVVTAVRDPIARLYSHFFEKVVYVSEQLAGTRQEDWTRERFVATFGPLLAPFLERAIPDELSYLPRVLDDGLALEFPNLGFQGVAANLTRFDGYARYASGRIVGLVLPTHNLVAGLRAAMAGIGVKPRRLVETVSYASDDRGFSDLYRGFLDDVPFSKPQSITAAQSGMARLLFPPAEMNRLVEKWSRRWAKAAECRDR